MTMQASPKPLLTTLLLALTLLYPTHALTWTQYGTTGCTGQIADSNQWTETAPPSYACITQTGASAEFGPSPYIECPVTWFSDVGCTGEQESVSQDGCFDFPGTGGSFRVDNCQR